MKRGFYLLLGCIVGQIGFGQVSFYDGTSAILGEEEMRSTICIGFHDLNNDRLEDLFVMDEGKVLHTFIQGTPNLPFASKEHLQTAFNGEWAFLAGDLENDGIPEIIVSGNEFGSQFFKRNGDTYIKQYGTNSGIYSQNSNLVDFNNDGFLDFFVCNDDGESLTYLNNGNGGMQAVKMIDFKTSEEDDMSGNYSSIFTDIDSDGDLDLYIGKCRAGVTDPTDRRRINTLYINNGDGTYSEQAEAFGLAIGAQSWSVDSGDVDNDGDLDMIIANHDGPHDLMINKGNGVFERRTLVPGGYESYAFQSFFCDFDNNGWLDIFFTEPAHSFILFNDEMSFSRRDIPFDGRKAFSAASGDVNNDGFPDLYFGFANSFQAPSDIADKVYLNETNSFNYLDIRLIGTVSNRDAVGAKVFIYTKDGMQLRELVVGKSYGIMNSNVLHFGLGHAALVDSVRVEWPSGMKTYIEGVEEINTLLTITEDGCTSSSIYLPNVQICNGEDAEITLPSGYDSYAWEDGFSESARTLSEEGWHRVKMEKDGCISYTNYFAVIKEESLSLSEILPATDGVFCKGDVVDLTAMSGQSYEWSNGSTTQSIEVKEAGTFRVTVTTNCATYISDMVEIQFADVNQLNIENDTIEPGNKAVFSGPSERLNWYQNKQDIIPLATGETFETPELEEDATYFVGLPEQGYGLSGSLMMNVPLNAVGDTIYEENEFVEFTVLQTLKLGSVRVRTQLPGERRFIIKKEEQEIWTSDQVLTAGVNKVTIDLELTPGTYAIGTDQQTNQNNFGTNHPNLSYSTIYVPNDKMIRGYIHIENSALYSGVSPYFFDWNLDYGSYVCEPRYPVYAIVRETVGVDDATWNFVCYPNPTSGVLYLESTVEVPLYIDMLDFAGRQIQGRVEVRQSPYKLSMPDIPGLYFLRVSSKKSIQTKKIIVY